MAGIINDVRVIKDVLCAIKNEVVQIKFNKKNCNDLVDEIKIIEAIIIEFIEQPGENLHHLEVECVKSIREFFEEARQFISKYLHAKPISQALGFSSLGDADKIDHLLSKKNSLLLNLAFVRAEAERQKVHAAHPTTIKGVVIDVGYAAAATVFQHAAVATDILASKAKVLLSLESDQEKLERQIAEMKKKAIDMAKAKELQLELDAINTKIAEIKATP